MTPSIRAAGARLRLPLSLMAIAGLAACGSVSLQEPGARSVTIERTAHGIAHVTAADYEGIAFGVAYAYAQDTVCQTADQLITVRGERTQFFGQQAMGQLGLRVLPNPQIDLFIRSHMDDAALARAQATASPEARAAVRGYVAGYNRYLQDAGPLGLPADCRNVSWVRPMTERDLARLTEQTMVLGGIGAFADAVLGAQPPRKAAGLGGAGDALAAASQPQEEVSLDEAARVLAAYSHNQRPDGGELGSNGWAFGRNATPDGAGVLLGNPHFPWVGANRFWQMHLTIPGQLDVMGGGIGNGSAVQIGFNRDVAWTHTVSTGKRFTLYELKLDPTDPTTYIVDGQKKKMVVQPVAAPGPLGGAPLTATVYRTQWGPVLVVPRAGLTWSATTAYAIADANSLNTRSADTWMRMNRARNVQELREAMGNQGIPWVNTIAADRSGQAMYADLSVVPDVSAAMLQKCAPSPRAAALLGAAGLPVLDGSRSECAWNKDPAAVASGITPPSRMPVIITQDWVQNSNDSFWLSNPAIQPPAGISPLVGPVGTPQRLRTRVGILEIQRRLAGSDTLPGNKMGVDEVRSVLFRNRNLAASLVLPDLLAACADPAATANAAVKEGCTALSRWDRVNDVGSQGAPLFREFWRKAKDIPNVWRVPFDPKEPVTTPTGLKMSDAAVRAAVLKALEDAVGIVKAAGYPADVALGRAQFRMVRGQQVGIPGGDEFEGVLNKVESQGQPTLSPGGYRINYGSSYIQAVTWDAKGPVAHGLLTYGQASDPASPYAYDQLPLFSAKRWVKLPFAAEDVKAQKVGQAVVLKY